MRSIISWGKWWIPQHWTLLGFGWAVLCRPCFCQETLGMMIIWSMKSLPTWCRRILWFLIHELLPFPLSRADLYHSVRNLQVCCWLHRITSDCLFPAWLLLPSSGVLEGMMNNWSLTSLPSQVILKLFTGPTLCHLPSRLRSWGHAEGYRRQAPKLCTGVSAFLMILNISAVFFPYSLWRLNWFFVESYLITRIWVLNSNMQNLLFHIPSWDYFTLHLLPLNFNCHFIVLSLWFLQVLGSSAQLAHSTDSVSTSVFSAKLVTPLFTLFHVTLACPTFILLLHACLVCLKAFGRELCKTPFGICRLCQLDHVYAHSCQPAPLKNSRDPWEVGFPLQKQPWITPHILYLYTHPNMSPPWFLPPGLVHMCSWQSGTPSSPWDTPYTLSLH